MPLYAPLTPARRAHTAHDAMDDHAPPVVTPRRGEHLPGSGYVPGSDDPRFVRSPGEKYDAVFARSMKRSEVPLPEQRQQHPEV